MSGHDMDGSSSPAEEEQDLNYRPPPLPHPAPKHRRYIQQRKRKRRNIQKGFSFQNPGAVERTDSSFIITKLSFIVRPQTGPSSTLFPRFAHLFPSCLQLAESTRPVREKGTESDRRRREMPPQPPQPQVRQNILKFLKSFLGIIRILQIVFGAGLWVTIAANKYEGSIHFVLFVAVLFWLLTLALFFITLLDKQDLVPLLGGERWLCTNLAHDVAAAVLYLPAIGVMIYKTDRNSYCNLEQYKHLCLYKVYLTAAVHACLCCLAYLLSVIYGACRKCRGEQTVI